MRQVLSPALCMLLLFSAHSDGWADEPVVQVRAIDAKDEINQLIRRLARDGVLSVEDAKRIGEETTRRLRPAWFPDGVVEAGAVHEKTGVWTVTVTLRTKSKASPGCTVIFRATGLESAQFFKGA